jgi:aryl-alcohol dehydrogenase-like predicted oxidoreductase
MSRLFQSAVSRRSLKRLRIDEIYLYLLHWRERTPPLQETVDAFEKLRAVGKIKRWGVSNFDVDDMEELLSLEDGYHVPRTKFCTISRIAKPSSIFYREEGGLATRVRSVFDFLFAGSGARHGFVDRIPSAAEPVLISVADLAPIVLAAAIWIPYVSFSKRVKATFRY